MKKKSGKKVDPYQVMAEEMADLIEKSEKIPWKRTFSGAMPRNLTAKDGANYQGFNLLYLMLLDEPDPYYVTFNQAKKLGGSVRKGANSKKICFFRNLEYDKNGKLLKELPRDATKEQQIARRKEVAKRIPILQYSSVFNAKHDCEGLEDKIPKPEKSPELTPEERHKSVFEMIEGLKKDICPMIEVERQPCYYPRKDVVGMPAVSKFKGLGNTHPIDNYAAVAFHEYAHATGHPKRLGRKGMLVESTKAVEGYAFEELVAEFASYLTLSKMGIQNPEQQENSAMYLKGWASKIRSNPKAFVAATFQATKAHKYLMGIDRELAKEKPEMMKELEKQPDVPIGGLVKGREKPETVPEVEGFSENKPESPSSPPKETTNTPDAAAEKPAEAVSIPRPKPQVLPTFKPLTEEERAARKKDFDKAIAEIDKSLERDVESEIEVG